MSLAIYDGGHLTNRQGGPPVGGPLRSAVATGARRPSSWIAPRTSPPVPEVRRESTFPAGEFAEAREQRRALRQTRHEECGATGQRAVAKRRTPARRPIDFAAVRSIISIGAVLPLRGVYRPVRPTPLAGALLRPCRMPTAPEKRNPYLAHRHQLDNKDG